MQTKVMHCNRDMVQILHLKVRHDAVYFYIGLLCSFFCSLSFKKLIFWSAAAKAASKPECRCLSYYWSHKVPAHNTSSKQSTLAIWFCGGLLSRQQSQCISVSMVWCRCTAHWHHLILDTITCNLPVLTVSSFCGWGQVMESAISLFHCSQQTYCWPPSGID